MKTVKTIRLISHLYFILVLVLAVSIGFSDRNIMLKTMASMLITAVLCYIARNTFKKSLSIAVQIIVMAFGVAVADAAFGLPLWAVIMVGVYGVVSFVSFFVKSECNFMERISFPYIVVAFLAISFSYYSAPGYSALLTIMGIILVCFYFFLLAIERKSRQIEIDKVNSVGVGSKIYKRVLIFTVTIIIMLGIPATAVSLVGKVDALDKSSYRVGKGLFKFFDILSKTGGEGYDDEQEEMVFMEQDSPYVFSDEYIPLDTEGIIAMVICIVGVVTGSTMGVIMLIRSYKNREKRIPVNQPTKELVISTVKSEPVVYKKEEDYSFRASIRKIYKKSIRGKNKFKRVDLECRTPDEHKDIRCGEGYNVTDKFVEMYERARYSNAVLNREDVLRMKKESKNMVNEKN